MAKKSTRSTRGKIIDAAWKLFYRQGYDDTTVEEIIEESGTSRGSFYHYFQGKDGLLSTLADVIDQKFEVLMESLDPDMDRFDQLMYLNREMFSMVESTISLDLVARLYSAQLVARGYKSLLDNNRIYYRLLRQIARQGQERGELRSDITANEIVRAYTLLVRGVIYDWCLSGGDYSLTRYSQVAMPMFMHEFRAGK